MEFDGLGRGHRITEKTARRSPIPSISVPPPEAEQLQELQSAPVVAGDFSNRQEQEDLRQENRGSRICGCKSREGHLDWNFPGAGLRDN
jgi:hypothetical protein